MKRISLLLSFLVLYTILPAQNVLTKTVEPFTKIVAFGGIDIELTEGNTYEVKLESDYASLENVTLKVEDNKLVLNTTKKILDKYRHVSAKITYKGLSSIKINAGCVLTSISEMKSDTLKLSAGSGSTINLKVTSQLISAEAGQGSTITLEGTTANMDAEAGSGGIINAFDLVCQNAVVKTNTGGLAKINVKQDLKASASMGGNISYIGSPVKCKTHTIFGGKVKQVAE